MLSKVVSSTIFKVFGMTRPGIEPRSPGPLANTLTAGPMSRNHGQANASRIILICQEIFQNYGTLEELNSDDGLPFTYLPFKQFLVDWTGKYRLSSVAFPQSDGRAELAGKTAKRIVNGITERLGSLDNDQAARAILQYQNTPIHNIGLSTT